MFDYRALYEIQLSVDFLRVVQCFSDMQFLYTDVKKKRFSHIWHAILYKQPFYIV